MIGIWVPPIQASRQKDEEHMIQSGLVSITFRQLTPEAIIALVAQAGLNGIEWGGDVHVLPGQLARAAEVRKRTAEAGIQVAAYGSYYRADQSEAEGLSFSSVLDTAEALGTSLLRVWPGKSAATATADERARVVADLQRVGTMAATRHIRVSCEFHGGSLTESNASAQQLVEELGAASVSLLWQPPVGKPLAYCLEGLTALIGSITNLHTFAWSLNADGHMVRDPLAQAETQWTEYLRVANTPDCDRYALLEYVKNDEPRQFLEDAATLKRWLKGLT